MAHIAYQTGKLKQALNAWGKALQLAQETQNAQGLYVVTRDLGIVLGRHGDKAQARQLLTLSMEVGRRAGFPDVHKVEAALRDLDKPDDPPQP